MSETLLAIAIGVFSSGLFTGLGAAIYKSWKTRGERNKDESGWYQRNSWRKYADELHATLSDHRLWCHTHHDAQYKDMPKRPTFGGK